MATNDRQKQYDNRRKLFDELSKSYEMGSFDKFGKDIWNEKKRKALYDTVSKKYEVGTFNDFSQQLGVGAAFAKPAPAKPATNTAKQILKSRPTMQIVDGKSVPAKQRNVQPAAKSGTNPLTQASQRFWQAQAEMVKPVTPAADTKSYAPGELLQKPKSNRELVDAAKKQLHATKPQAQAQPWKFSEQVHSSNQNEPSLAGAIDSATEAVKRQHASMTAQLKLNSPLPMTKEEVAARAEDEVAHEDYVAEQNRQQDFDRGINGLLAKYKTKDAAEKAWANAEARTKASREAHNDKIWSDYAMMGGGPQARMAAAGETYTSNLADYLKEHDLQMMANDAWASLGRAKQQGLISGMADMVRKQYPKMSDGEVRKMATRLARQHSDQAVFDLAVKKNTPKSATDLFLRHAIGMSSVAMLQEGLARSKAGSTGDWAAREVAEQKYNKGLKNKAASIAGSVVGLAVDPLTIFSAGVSSVGAKAATAASAKLIGKAATRKAATTLGGRIAMGAIQGAANFGTFEAGREVAEQARWGGHRNEDTGDVEGYSLGAVGKQFGHGAVMGAATGVVAPMVGNISDKLVKATASTAGKAAIRTGELGVSTLAEGTIFSVPEWASGNRDAMDVWTDNLAMMAGFKGHHLIKSVPHTIDALRKADNPTNMAERNHNRRSFEERLRMVLDGQHTDLALSKEEQDELKRGGYDDLNILVTDHARYVDKQKPDGKSREADPSRTIESKTHNDDVSYDIPYNRFEQLMSDGQISEAARAKMYYYLTGHIVPMSTVIGGSTFESVGQDGKTNYTVQSIGANGVVTSRTFANKRQADLEETRIMRQAELNGIDIGEQHYNNLADSKRFSRACNIVADEIGAPVNMIKELMHRDPKTITPTEQDVVKRVTEHYDSLADDFSLDTVRKDVETDTGVDIDKAISKDASKRSSDEQRAVKTYISRLYDGVEMPKWEFVNDPSYNTRRIDITDDDTPYDDEVADEEKGEMPVDHSVDKAYTDGYNAYTDGYNATDVADRKDVKMRHDELRGELSFATDEDFKILDDSPTVAKEAVMSHDDWSENQKEQALAYINAKEAFAGVVDRIKEDADSMEAQQHEELKQKQHTDGALHPATLKETDEKGHGKEVFIVDGHVQMTEDGSMVDHANSDKTVVVFDPTTGERKMIDPTSDTGLSAVGEVLNFEDEQAKISENAQQYIQEQYDEMNGKVRVELGQKIVLPTGEDAVVVAIFPDNGNITAMLEDGSQKFVSHSELQQMADEQAIADYRQRNGIKDEPPASSEVSEPTVTQGESVVEGAPSDFTPDMELTIRDEDGTEKPALVMGRVRYENGSFVPDDNGSIVEYYADGEVMHEHESKLADKVVSHVSSEQEDVQAVDTPATEAEAPKDDNTSDSDVAAEEEDATENVPATQTEVAEEATGEAEQEQTALSRIPKDEKGNPMLEETDPETAWDGTVEYMDNADDAREYVDSMVAQLTKDVESAKKRVGKVKNTGSMEQFKADKAAAREEQAAAERRLAHWQQIAGVDEARKEAERQRAAEVRAEEERIAHDKAVAQAQADFEARKAAEAERKAVGNENPMPAITEKWNTATKIDGHKDEIMLPNGEPLKGHYVLHESGASSPSHNSENWAKTDGFPMDANDNSVNDRDYERDRDAQRHTEGIAQQYDQRALQNVPVVSNDGVVLSGNGRTIAGEIAARNNTDGAYVDYLKEYAHKFGFTPEQVEGMHHPRVSFVPDDAMPYTAETFARFNQQEMKSQNKTEQAVKLGKTVSDDSFGRIVRTINGYDTLGDFYNDPQASLGAVNDLHGAGVIPQAQMAEMVDGGRGNQRLSAVGREFLENMLIGKAFDGNPDVVRMLTEIPSMRQSVITALGEISDNIALGDGWALQNELADAVKLVYDARNDGDYQHGDIVSVYARQGRLFADPDELQTVADFNNMTMLMLADVLNDKRVTMLKTTLALYNKDARDSANGVQDIFAGGVVSREEILRNVIKFINNAQRKELEAAHAAAVERRKTEGVQQDGTPPQVDNEPTAAAEQPSAERGQSKSNTLSQENTEPRQIKLSDPRTMSDEEKQRRGEMLRDAYAIEVTVGQIVATEEVSARRAAEKWWDENVSEPAFYDTEAGEVEINRNSVESSLAHRYGQMKLDAITSLIDGFENAVYLGTMPDSRERGVVDHYFAYPIMYNGERCYVFCRAMQDANKNRLYVHEVFVAERIKKGDTLQTAASKPHGGISLYRDILANVLDASKEEVRSASEEQNEQSATDNTLRAEDKSDNPTTPNGNVSNSSAGKVTESSEELQGKEDKFTPVPIEDGEDYVDYAARVAAVKAQHDAIKAAENATDTNPTDGQKKAGNYKKGHVQIGAFDISVEQPKGSVRRGKDADGKEWESKMNNTYGYFRGTEGVDGDHIDVFLSNDIDGWNGRKVFVVDQYNPDGTFDEHKVMLGFNDADDAKSNYLANYEKGWENGRRIDVSTTNLEDFEKWISSSHRKTKPFAEYKGVKIDEVQSASHQLPYSIEPATYTNKKGKTTAMHLLKFDADLTKEQTRAINEFAKEKLSDGRFAKARGWRDRESGGWMFRSEEDAKKAAEMVNDAKVVEDAQPLSVEDMAEATDHAAVKAVDEAIKVEQEPQTTPQYDYDRENNVYDTVLAGLRETFNNRPAGSIPNIKAIEKEIRDLRKRAKTIENGMATATGETIPQAFDALAGLNGRRKAFEQFLTDLRVKMAEVGRDKALAAHGLKLGDKIMYKGKEATIYDADQYQVTLDVGLAPIVYEAVDWNKLELPQHNKEQQDGRVPSVEHKADEVQGTLSEKPKQKLQPKKVNVGSLFGELYKDGKAKLSDHTEEPKQESRQEESQEQPKQEEKKAKSKWVDDEDVERFEELRKRLKAKLRGQLNMGVDPEIFAAGVEMSYLMLKHGARKFAEFSKQMLEALGEEVRPYLKSFYNGARDLPEMEDYEKEMTPYDEVRDFDVKNFDKESAKDLVETAEHIVREQEVEQEAKEATKKLKKKRNEERKEDNKQSAANTDQKDVEASKEQVTKPTSTTDFIRNKGRFMSEADIEGALGKIFVDKETGSEIKVGKFVSPHDVAIKINGDASIILWPRLANTLNKENWQEVNNERVDAQEDTAKESGQEKKDISLQQQPISKIIGDLFDKELNPKSNEQEVHVQPRTSTTERKGGYQRGQNEPLGASQQHEDERTDTSRVAGRSGDNTMSDSAGSSRVSKPSDGKRDVKPSKPEPAPLAESERKNIHNNHAERGTDYAPKSVSARIEANIKAIETMQRLVGSGQPATPEDMAVLRKFSGWGGLGEAFSEMKGGPYGSINTNNKRLRELLSPEAYEAANMSRNSAYYTPAPVIDTLWDVARAMGFRGGNVLEGSAGVGNILGLMPTDMSEQSNIHAVEIDETAGNILSLLYPDANVEVKGFEKTHVTNGSVDLAITNVPFVTGLRVMDETGDKDLSRKFHDIHDFCIAKNVRKLKDGGVGIFITSSGTLDSPNSAKLRTWLVNEGGADVVGAFRMHNQTFGGTGATSDIIVVRKRVNGQKSANAIDVSGTLPIRTVKYNTGETKRGSSKIIIKDLALDVNKHFVEHPEDMAGEMAFAFEKGDTYRATSKALYPSQSINQEQRLSEWAQQFKDMDWDKSEERESQQVVYGDLGEDVKEGSMLLDSDGNLCLAQRGKAVPINVNANKVKGHTKAECFNAYKTIKDAVADVLEYQRTHSNDTGLKQKLDMLNKAYDAFVKTYGHLNKNTSISFLRSDIDFPSIAALESVSETSDKSGKRIVTYGKTDIFSRRVVETESEPKPTTVKDGIIASIYLNGRVDVPYIAERLNMSDADVRQQIIESGFGFENPTTTEMEVSYEYLSGNVREKLYQAKENNTDGRYNENIKALERIIPMNIPAHLIEFTLGSSWIEPKLYEDFVKERTGLDVKLTNAGGTWVMSEPYWTNTEKNKAMGVISEKCDKTILGHELIKAAITCKSINVTKTISTGYGSSKTTETIVDKEATMACANKIDEIRQDFKDWARGKMQNDPEMSERMELVYNDLFNNSVPKEIPNEFVPEHFGGAASVVNGKPFQLRPHQAKAVIRATTQPLMLAHEVGTGKTYTLISTAMEMRRLGTARKPMIVVQNATVGQFVASAKALYPNAKVLTIEDADRNTEGRRNFYAKIRYNDWDMVVVPQSVFERIPDSEERQIRFIEDKVEEKMMVLEKMREAANDDRDPVLRQVQRELDKLNDELNDHKLALSENKADGKVDIDKKREAKTKQNAMVKAQEMLDREIDDAANFDDMGIDALLIDEAHEYKHLGFATAMQRGVKGVDPSDSKKSQGVYLKTQAVLENKNGKNVIFATGTPISNTAAEIWTFMRYLMPADTMREYGIYYFDDFVRNFGNIQQMLEFATNGKYKENNRFAGYVNLPELVRIWACVADTVLTREAGGVSDKIPKMEGGKAQDIYLPQTKALRSVMKFVKDQLDDYEEMSGKEKKENSHIPLVMYGIAKAAAVDARLVLGDAADEPNSKTNEAVRQTLRSLEDTKEYNGTVAIFADNYQNKVSGFNLYEDIRKKLIDAGVPEAQVVVMKSGMSIKKKLEIFDKVNRGEVRVIMGSTFTLGTGVNIQERLHTLIHVDAPNRPMDYTQRNGRILRQGNLHNEWGIPVRVLRFGVEDSLDVTAYQRLKTKGAIADSIMEGKKMMSNSMEDRVLEEEQDLFGDITAQLSGSQYALLKNQVEKEVRKLEARQKQWEADQAYVHNQKPRLKALIKDSEERAERNKKSLAKVEAAKNDGITIGKMKFSSLDDMADYLKEYNSKQREQQEQVRMASGYNSEAKSDLTINVGGFDFHVKRVITKDQKKEKGQLSLSFFSKTKMTYSCPELGLEDVPVDGQRLKSALEDILENVLSGDDFREKAEYADRAAERYKGELQQVEARDGKPFEYTDELKQAKKKLAEYEELMKAEMAVKDAKYAEMDASVETANSVTLSDEASEENEDDATYRDYDDDESWNDATQENANMMRTTVQQMSEKLHTPIKIVEDVESITHQNASVQERRRNSKGWYDVRTSEVVVVLPNNRDVEDVAATVMHETVAHKGLRELVGEEHYDDFLDEVYKHLRGDLKQRVDAEAGRAFVDDSTKNGERAKSYEQHRRTAVDELFGDMAEKPFEEFSEGERTLWQKLKEIVRKLLDKFLESLKLPRWFELGDNELRYMLWRSKERLERGKEHPIDLARDMVMREELGLSKAARMRMGDTPDTFKARQKRAVEKKGIVMPGLNEAEVKVVDVPRHSFTGTGKDVLKAAEEWARKNIVGTHTAINSQGKQFEYEIGNKSVGKYVSSSSVQKSHNLGIHLSVLKRLPEVIQTSIEAEIHPDYTKNDSRERTVDSLVNVNSLIHRFYGAVDIDGKIYRVKTTIREFGDANLNAKAHNYEVTKIELIEAPSTYGLEANHEHLAMTSASSISVAKLLKDVEKSYDSGKKVLDESRKADENPILYRDGGETEDIWKDKSMGLHERTTAAAMRLADKHQENKTLRNDAMRAIGNNLADLRKAMSLQRKFDMATVKRVSDLARVLMNNGYIGDMTQQEVKSLLAAVRNSVGHNDIDRDVQKVMEIMVKNQLRRAEKALSALEAIKGSKVNAKGVKVQGKLDAAGAQLMEVFKKTRGWEKNDIEEAIADAQGRMSSDDATVAENATIEYAGLQFSMEYAEKIRDSKVEESRLKEEIKKSHEETSERNRNSESYRQYIASLQDAILQNKIERAEAYFNLVGRLSDGLRESMANATHFKKMEKMRINEIHHYANSDMQGRPSNEHYKPEFADKFVNNSFVSFVFAPLATFDQMLRVFGNKSANGEGYLYNRFMRGWVDARQQEIKGVREKFATLDDKAKEIFGGKVKTWSDLIRYVGNLPKGVVSFWNGGEMQEYEMAQGNLMYIYMVNKMLDGKMKLRKMGITDEHVENIAEVLDPRLIKLADWLQGEFLVDTRNEYNETHKRMFGASMAAVEDYFPLKILANAREDKPENLDTPDKGDGISTSTGSIVKRTRNGLALDLMNADALHVILDHVTQMEHWNAFVEFNRDLNTLRTYKRFRNQVQNMTTIYGSGKELWKKFNDVCQMAAGTYRPPRAKLDEAAVNFAKGVTAAKVSFRMFTALKQFLSMPAYIPEVRADYLLKSIVNPVEAWTWSMEHLPIFNERWNGRMAGDPRLLKTDKDWKLWRTRIVQLAARVGMSPNAFVDALTVCIGARAMYQTRLAQYLREGYSQEAAEKRAIQDAEILYNQTQQSSEGAFLSTMQVDRSWLSVLFTIFRNSSMAYTRQLYDALRNLERNLTPGYREGSIAFMKKQFMDDGIDEVQAEWNAKRKYYRQLRKDFLRVATFSLIMQFAWNLGAYLPYLLLGDDDQTKKEFWNDVLTHTLFGSIEGLTGGDIMSQAGNMLISGEGNPVYLIKDMPLTSDLKTAFEELGNGQYVEALSDMVNLVVQSGIGVNPQSITDTALAIMDACGDDPVLAHEATICVCRILQVPQSQIDKMYFDEVGLSGSEVSKYTPAQLAERYARFKVKRGAFFAPWAWDDEGLIGGKADNAEKIINARVKAANDTQVNEAYLKYEDSLKDIDKQVSAANEAAKTDYLKAAQMYNKVQSNPKAYNSYLMFKEMDNGLNRLARNYMSAKSPEEARLHQRTIQRYKAAMVKALNASNERERDKAIQEIEALLDDYSNQYEAMQGSLSTQ